MNRADAAEQAGNQLADWLRESGFAEEAVDARALDPDGYPFAVIGTGILFEEEGSDEHFSAMLDRLYRVAKNALATLGEQSPLWIRRWPEIAYGVRPKRVRRGLRVSDVWSHPDAVAKLVTTVRLTRKDHGPLEIASLEIKPEGEPVPVLADPAAEETAGAEA
jgi:hypothetical protein